jgi:predicted TIM-barrel fold metal-dependent hydrolase
MKIIEPHVHIWTLDTERFPWSPATAAPPTYSATAEELLETLDANGVAGAVLVQVIYYGTDNSYAADAMRRYPDRFAGVCLVDPQRPDAPSLLEREVRDNGFTGLRLRPSADRASTWLSDPVTFPLWEKAAELGVTISLLTHIEQLAMLTEPVRRFPEVPVIIDHLAWPPLAEGPDGPAIQHLLRLVEQPSVHVKITDPWVIAPDDPYPYRSAEPIYRRVFETFGAQRCLWGTDWPLVMNHCSYAEALKLYTQEWDWLTDADREWILFRTVQKLYPKPFAALG